MKPSITESWIDKKRFKYAQYVLAFVGAILGVLSGESAGEKIGYALGGAILGGLSIPLIIAFPLTIFEVLVVWIKARKAKSDAYHMIEYGRIYPNQFQKVTYALEQWGGKEGEHLLNDLYELQDELKQAST